MNSGRNTGISHGENRRTRVRAEDEKKNKKNRNSVYKERRVEVVIDLALHAAPAHPKPPSQYRGTHWDFTTTAVTERKKEREKKQQEVVNTHTFGLLLVLA